MGYTHLSAAQLDLALRILNEQGKKDTLNASVIVSPVSIATGLSICLAGARNQTAAQIIRTVFGNSLSQDDIRTYISQAMERLNPVDNRKYTLKSVNRVYVKSGSKLSSAFRKAIKEHYKDECVLMDFKSTEKAVQLINAYISSNASVKFHDALLTSRLSRELKILVVSAMHFRGNWFPFFDKSRSLIEIFHCADGYEQKVKMLTKRANFHYYENQEVQVLCLPYPGKELFMQIVLPKNNISVDDLLRTANVLKLSMWLQIRRVHLVHVKLPRFGIRSSIDLRDILIGLGIKDAFEDSADFSAMSDKKLKLSQVAQEILFEWTDEKVTLSRSPSTRRSNSQKRSNANKSGSRSTYTRTTVSTRASMRSYRTSPHTQTFWTNSMIQSNQPFIGFTVGSPDQGYDGSNGQAPQELAQHSHSFSTAPFQYMDPNTQAYSYVTRPTVDSSNRWAMLPPTFSQYNGNRYGNNRSTDPKLFHVNRPFLFFVSNLDRDVLFSGVVRSIDTSLQKPERSRTRPMNQPFLMTPHTAFPHQFPIFTPTWVPGYQ